MRLSQLMGKTRSGLLRCLGHSRRSLGSKFSSNGASIEKQASYDKLLNAVVIDMSMSWNIVNKRPVMDIAGVPGPTMVCGQDTYESRRRSHGPSCQRKCH